MKKSYLKTIRTKYQTSTISKVVSDMERKGLIYDVELAYVYNEVMEENGI